ncbi:MAG: FAD-binding protein [Cytophagales bacterium]|nr:FAD-binding protein [Cytophagales bacterium]
MSFEKNYLWENNHQNIQFRVERLYDLWSDQQAVNTLAKWKSAIDYIKSILQEAEANNKCVRTVGGGWSLSEVLKTNDYFLNTQPLNIIDIGLPKQNVTLGIDAENLVLAQCGVSILEINRELKMQNKALPTSGASDGQTIIGAMATGTHGAALEVGSMQDFALGLHLITANNEEYWIEGSTKILTDTYVNFILPGAIRINDDDVFQSAIVSFGCYGIIHAVLFQCEPLYVLEVYQDAHPWSIVSQCINGPSNFNLLGLKPNPHHFELNFNPYNHDQVMVKAMYKLPGSTPTTYTPPQDGQYGAGADVLSMLGQITGAVPVIIPSLRIFMDSIIKSSFPKYTGEKGFRGDIFGSGQTLPISDTAGLSTEIGIDATNSLAVLNIVLNVSIEIPFQGLISVRYVKKSKATLAFTKFDTTCTIEFPSAKSQQTLKFFNALWDALDNNNIPYTFHWGQCNNLNKSQNLVRKHWGNEAVDKWLNARNRLLKTPMQKHMFSNEFIDACGLNQIPA